MLVGICGQSGSGKDTVADHLIANHGFVKVAFADPMKRFCQEVFDFTDEQVWGASEHRNAPDYRYPMFDPDSGPGEPQLLTPRFALQTLGTEWGRRCYPDVWVEYALKVYKRLMESPYARYHQRLGVHHPAIGDGNAVRGVVISDVRFINEVNGIKRVGGHVIKVVRPGYEGKVGVSGHASEEEQKTIPEEFFSATIKNNSTIEDLMTVVDAALNMLGVIK